MVKSSLAFRAATFCLTAISFYVASASFGLATGLSAAEWPYAVALAIAALTFWIVTELRNADDEASPLVTFVGHLSVTTGINLIVQGMLGYAFDLSLVPVPVLVGGGALASASVVLVRSFRTGAHKAGLVVVGYDPIITEMAGSAGCPIEGVVEDEPSRVPAPLRTLGTFKQVSLILPSYGRHSIVVGRPDWTARVPAADLLRVRLAGARIQDVSAFYETVLRRVCYARLSTRDLLFSQALRTGRHIMAIQAVYTDLMGLLFLLVFSPVLILAGLGVALFCGKGPVLERVECLGFQNVPFELMRFRTRDGKTGARTRFGNLIASLRLVNLPQLINIMRGEVVFFGPRPVRLQFADRMAELLPFYLHKFSVKPGVLGWAQANLPRRTVPSEVLRLEYDFYYIRQGSLALDFEILMRTFFGGKRQPEAGDSKP